jgi:hypothetical protein
MRLPWKGAGIGEASKIGPGAGAFFGSIFPGFSRTFSIAPIRHANRQLGRR